MVHTGVESRSGRRAARTIVLTVPGETEPEVYLVYPDVFNIIGKMLATNQLSSSFGNGPRFEYDEVRFILRLLGASLSLVAEGNLRPVDLWVSAE